MESSDPELAELRRFARERVHPEVARHELPVRQERLASLLTEMDDLGLTEPDGGLWADIPRGIALLSVIAEHDVSVALALHQRALARRMPGATDLVVAVPQEIWGLNPETGKLRWYAAHGLTGNVSPSLVQGGDVGYIFGGFPSTRSVAVKLGGKGDTTADAVLWDSNTSSYVPTPIYKDGYLYVVNDQGFATCIDAKTGDDVYRERVIMGSRGGGKPFYASPVLVGDKLICMSRRNGAFIIEAKPEFKLVGTNVLESDDSYFHGTPAVSRDRLFLRSDRAVYCIGAK